MAKNEFIPLDTALALADEYVSNLDDLCALRDSLEDLNPADVIPREQMSNSVEEALIALDTFYNEGQLDYSAYSALYDLISSILPDEKEET